MQATRPTIASYLWIDGPDEGTPYPQVGPESDSSLSSVQAIYWRTAAVFYATSVRANPGARHVLFTNATPPAVDGHDLEAYFSALDVELANVRFDHRPPDGYWPLWGNQFWILDILGHLGAADLLPALLVDVDCLFVASGDRLFDVVDEHGIANYVVEEIESDPSYSANGLTTPVLQRVSEEIVGRSLPTVRYCGGELFGATAAVAETIVEASEDLWTRCLDRNARGLPKLNTEEHFFSCLYAELGLPAGTANGLVRRIWTQRAYRNASQSDLELDVWHLPAEKKYGFRRLYSEVTNFGSTFWQVPLDATFTQYLARNVGVPSTTVGKRVRDIGVAGRERLGRSRFHRG